MGWIVFHFLPQTVDMHRHGDVIAQRFQSPYHLVQILPAEHLPRMAHEKHQQFVLLVFQGHLLPVFRNAAAGGVRRQRTHSQHRRLRRGGLQPSVLRQMGLDPRHQHAGRKRLFDVVIRAIAEAADLIHVLAQCRDHEDGDVLDLPHPAADGEAVHPRQHQIQKQEVEWLLQRRRQAGHAIRTDGHLETAQLQIILLNGSDVLIILDNKYLSHRFPPLPVAVLR